LKILIGVVFIIGLIAGVVWGSPYIRTWAAPLLEGEGETLPSTPRPTLATPGTITPLTEAQKLRLSQSVAFQTRAKSAVGALFRHLNSGNEATLAAPGYGFEKIYPVVRKLMLNMETENGQYHFYDDFTSTTCSEFHCEFKVSVQYSTASTVTTKIHTIQVNGAPLPDGSVNVFMESFQ
jgi:hypothetical protein